MFAPLDDIYRLAPELLLCAFGVLVMLVDPFLPRRRRGGISAFIALLGAGLALASVRFPAAHPGTAFSGLMRIDSFSIFLHIVVGAVAVLVILGSADYLQRENLPHGEYYALVLFATAGMGVMVSAQELVTAFIGLEVSSIASYILASFRRDAPKSNESALKYFLLGSFATAFFLYGVALVYGATGTTMLDKLATADVSTLLTLGLAMIFVGLAFKVAAAPFQLWTPDVYEGAPAPVTALLSAGPKAAAFAILLRIFATVLAASDLWLWALWISAALTMFAGNLAALVQSNLKRMLAYSSIAHAGYILVAFAARNEIGMAAVLFYLVAYALMKVGAFIMVAHLAGPGERRLEIDDFAGLGAQQPLAAACLTLYLLSLLGLPVTAGFLGKFYIFKAALNSRLIWLVILMAINSVIGAYYYLRVIVVMYMREPREQWPAAPMPHGVALAVLLTAVGTIYFGLFPNAVMAFASQSSFLPR